MTRSCRALRPIRPKSSFLTPPWPKRSKTETFPKKQKNSRITMRWILNIMLYGGYEVPQKCLFVAEDFTVGNGMLTQTMKLKRPLVMKQYGAKLQSLY
jgi:long-subunit acyl-CoA synthetase (AMP-forming)